MENESPNTTTQKKNASQHDENFSVSLALLTLRAEKVAKRNLREKTTFREPVHRNKLCARARFAMTKVASREETLILLLTFPIVLNEVHREKMSLGLFCSDTHSGAIDCAFDGRNGANEREGAGFHYYVCTSTSKQHFVV